MTNFLDTLSSTSFDIMCRSLSPGLVPFNIVHKPLILGIDLLDHAFHSFARLGPIGATNASPLALNNTLRVATMLLNRRLLLLLNLFIVFLVLKKLRMLT